MIRINLNSPDGNAFCLIATVVNLMTQAELDEAEIKSWINDATSSQSYDELVEKARIKCEEVSEFIDDEVEIISTEHYEMYN